MKYFTSLELSKKLKEAGCELESKIGYLRKAIVKNNKINFTDKADGICVIKNFNKKATYPAYDIMYDICIRFYKEFFGVSFTTLNNVYCEKILFMLQHNKPQEEIEKYIWDNCVFNKKKGAK